MTRKPLYVARRAVKEHDRGLWQVIDRGTLPVAAPAE
jgi:hypothetical protein